MNSGNHFTTVFYSHFSPLEFEIDTIESLYGICFDEIEIFHCFSLFLFTTNANLIAILPCL